MRLLGSEKSFKDNKEKMLYELGIALTENKVLQKKVQKLEQFKKVTFDEQDINKLNDKIALYKNRLHEVNESGNKTLHNYSDILDLEKELVLQRTRLVQLKTGRLNYLHQDKNKIKADCIKKIEQLEEKLNHLLYD
ncbi:MAG TPA: hypothetical protein DCY20_04680 [Firmicutes bacterium]|nr:hypothetical protein [Bacillota bacterium]